MANKTGGKSTVAHYASYKLNKRWETNRKRRLERVLKEQPNNEQVKAALKGMVYRRKTPKQSEWSASWVRVAKIMKKFTGRFDRDIMSSNQDVSKAALSRQGPIAARNEPQLQLPKSMFALALRNNMNGSN